jgi:hypothetical protein
MIHLKKFNESLSVVDPMMDAIEFREKFGSRIDTGSYTDKILKNIESNNITQTDEYDTYEVYEVNERRYKSKLIGYFNAISKSHARIRAAVLKSNIEILITGFYEASILTEQNIKNILATEHKKIKDIQKNIDNLENPY